MREMGNWREYQIERLANDQEAAIDYLQLTLEEYLVDGDLPFFLKGLQTFVESQAEFLSFLNAPVLNLKSFWKHYPKRMLPCWTCLGAY